MDPLDIFGIVSGALLGAILLVFLTILFILRWRLKKLPSWSQYWSFFRVLTKKSLLPTANPIDGKLLVLNNDALTALDVNSVKNWDYGGLRMGDGSKLIQNLSSITSNSEFFIPPGVYRLPSTFYISNVNNVTIRGDNAVVLIGPDHQNILKFENCSNVIFHGIILIRENSPFTQGKVTALGSGFVDFVICDGYPSLQGFPNMSEAGNTSPVSLFDKSSKTYKKDCPSLYSVVKSIGGSNYRFNTSHPTIEVGDFLTFRGPIVDDVVLYKCKEMTLSEITVQNGSGFVFHDDGGKANRFLQCGIVRAPKPNNATIETLLSCNADGLHSSNCIVGPSVESCYFERLNDDGVAIHGKYGRVASVSGSMVQVDIPNPEVTLAESGENIEFVDGQGNPRGSARVVSRSGTTLTLDNTPAGIVNGWFVDSTSRKGSGFQIKNTTIFENRARGFLIKASDGSITDCNLIRCTDAGIVLSPELSTWAESGFSNNVSIQNCVIDGTGYASDGALENCSFAGAISITNVTNSSVSGHNNIVVKNNTVKNVDGIQILATDVKNLTLTNNDVGIAGQSRRGSSRYDTSKQIFYGKNVS